MFAYPGCKGEGSVDLELCLPIDLMNALENDQEFIVVASLVTKKFQFWSKSDQFRTLMWSIMISYNL